MSCRRPNDRGVTYPIGEKLGFRERNILWQVDIMMSIRKVMLGDSLLCPLQGPYCP